MSTISTITDLRWLRELDATGQTEAYARQCATTTGTTAYTVTYRLRPRGPLHTAIRFGAKAGHIDGAIVVSVTPL